MADTYDVVVAGLGPAGAVALWHMARMGYRVVGVDLRNWNNLWGKPCGDAIGAHHVTEAGLPPLPSSVIRNRVTAIDIYSPGETTKYRVTGEGYIIDRRAMGEWLLREAEEKGADVMLNTAILGPIVEDGKVTGIRVRRNGRVEEVRGRLVIEATGFSRVIRTRLPREWPVAEDIAPTDMEIAYREIIEYEDYTIDEPSVIRIYLDQEVAPGGYWWFFPESSKAANAGLGVQGGKGYPNPHALYRKLVSSHLLFASRRFRVRTGAGAPLPTRRPSNTMVGPGVVVIGDAGYTVNPLHGGGMGYAFRAAYLAAKAFDYAYNQGEVSIKNLWGLNRDYMHAVGARQAALDVFRIFLQRLSNDEIRYGMEKRLIPEQDVYYTSTEGDIKLTVVEKASIILRGLGRPSLLARLKTVADYMKKVRSHYLAYPESPEGLPEWIRGTEELYKEYLSKLEK